MTDRTTRLRIFVLAIVIVMVPACAARTRSDDLPSQAPVYTLTAIPTLLGYTNGFFPDAINDNGEVVGQGLMRGPIVDIAFLYKDGKTMEIKPSITQRHGVVNQAMEANGINGQGQIACASDASLSSPSVFHACLVDEKALGTAIALPEKAAPDAPSYSASHAIGINSEGVCVGHVFAANVGNMACEWRKGTLFLLGTLGGPQSYGAGINDKAQVVGGSDLGDHLLYGGHSDHAFLWTYNGGMRDLGTLGGDFSSACCISNLGIAVGQSTLITAANNTLPTPPVTHGCFWQRGKIYDLGVSPTGGPTFATSINDNGDIAGAMQMAATRQLPVPIWHACLWHRGHLYDLNDLVQQDGTWELRSANQDQTSFSPFCAFINNQGQITGYGVHNGKLEGYLLTPTATAGPKLSAWSPRVPVWSWRRDRPCPDSRETDRRDAGQDRHAS